MATQDFPETGDSGGASAPIDIARPARQAAPVVFASPHSGAAYPPDFVADSPLDLLTLRRSEDCFVDALFAAAPEHGMPLLRALFPRAFIDPNREPFELDPGMFEDELPSYANTSSTRVQAGRPAVDQCRLGAAHRRRAGGGRDRRAGQADPPVSGTLGGADRTRARP